MARVLLVDDDPAMLFATRAVVRASGHETVQAQSGAEALQKLEGVDLVVTDFAMPKMDGIELLEAIRQREPGLPVLLLTAHGSEKVAVRAIKAGAYDYVTKPFDVDELAAVVERALEMQSLRLRNRRLEAEKAIGKSFVADSPSMTRLLEVVSRIAPKDITVLVRGETGTGKEIISSLLHAQSRRAAGPLVRFNCAAIPAELADAELFGHTKGAFTGATQGRRGFFAEANGGTIVLDEIGELPLALQPKLLRVLQEGEIQPVGAGRVEKVDVRVVASTNRDLLGEAHLGRFRSDLYYRLAVLEVVVPPLREHREDIPGLAAEFARRHAQRFGLERVTLSPELVAKLRQAEWPGNVRQLENTIARLVALARDGDVLGPNGFGDARRPRTSPALLAPAVAGPTQSRDAGESAAPDTPPAAPEREDAAGEEESLTLYEQLDALERSVIINMLARTRGNQSDAARRLGMSRTTLIDRLKKHRLG